MVLLQLSLFLSFQLTGSIAVFVHQLMTGVAQPGTVVKTFAPATVSWHDVVVCLDRRFPAEQAQPVLLVMYRRLDVGVPFQRSVLEIQAGG